MSGELHRTAAALDEKDAASSASELPSLLHPVIDQCEELRAKVHALRLGCPETKFLGWRQPHRFVCAQGHEFKLTPATVIRTLRSCPKCDEQHRFVELQAKVARVGLQLLGRSRSNRGPVWRFRCGHGHEWTNRQLPQACPHCFASVRMQPPPPDPRGLDRLQAAARVHGGTCLDEAYLGAVQRHRFRCEQGHEWKALPTTVIKGGWCRACTGKSAGTKRPPAASRPLADLARAAQLRGGACLSETIAGHDGRLRFRCALGHKWLARPSAVLHGEWCPKCQRGAQHLKAAQAAASEHGGRCLSMDGSDERRALFWACTQGHVWRTTLRAVERGQWCRQCVRPGRTTAQSALGTAQPPLLFFMDPEAEPALPRG